MTKHCDPVAEAELQSILTYVRGLVAELGKSRDQIAAKNARIGELECALRKVQYEDDRRSGNDYLIHCTVMDAVKDALGCKGVKCA